MGCWEMPRNLPLRLEEGKVFFSEEQKQKTFGLVPTAACRPWPDRWEAAEK